LITPTGGHIGNQTHAHQTLEDVFDFVADLSRPTVIALGGNRLWLTARSKPDGKK